MEEEDEYELFYKDAVRSVRLVFLYINEKNELIYSKKCNLPLENETITKSQLLYLLKKNAIYNNSRYYPQELLQYNIALNSEDVRTFLEDPDDFNFMRVVQYLNGIRWKKTIKFFQPLNSLYILMKERVASRSSTKRIFLSSKKRKTRRKYI